MNQRKDSRLKFKEIPLDEIFFSDDKTPDEKNVHGLVDSILVRGVLQPLIVKRTVERHRGKKNKKIVLIAGRDRYEAARRADLKTVPCVFVRGDETDLQITALSENLHRKAFDVFERAEMRVRFYELVSRSVNFSDHVDRKSKRGRPSSGISRAARKLPDVWGSFEARRQRLGRDGRILNLGPEVKRAAKNAGLKYNQRALLRIAGVPSKKRQLSLIADYKKNRIRKQKKALVGESKEAHARSESPPLQPSQDEGEGRSIGNRRRETTYDELIEHWGTKGKELWAFAPFGERQAFLGKLERARCKAPSDAVAFLRKVFRGRFEVEKRQLYALAKSEGVSPNAVRRAARDLGYTTRKNRLNEHPSWYFQNLDRHWKNQSALISSKQLMDALGKVLSEKPVDRWDDPLRPNADDYFKLT